MPDTQRQTNMTTAASSDVAILCDAAPLARLLDSTLGQLGLSARQLPPSMQALRALQAMPPAVLIVLLMGRDPCALSLCQKVGQDPAFAGTRLVIVQDSMRPIDLRRAHAFGADAVLPLPLDPGALGAAVRTFLHVTA